MTLFIFLDTTLTICYYYRMKNKLKPCPFCGDVAVMMERKRGHGKYLIGCAEVTCIEYLPPDIRKSQMQNYGWCWNKKEDAINAWNKRVK